jgi:hypothetical protein
MVRGKHLHLQIMQWNVSDISCTFVQVRLGMFKVHLDHSRDRLIDKIFLVKDWNNLQVQVRVGTFA